MNLSPAPLLTTQSETARSESSDSRELTVPTLKLTDELMLESSSTSATQTSRDTTPTCFTSGSHNLDVLFLVFERVEEQVHNCNCICTTRYLRNGRMDITHLSTEDLIETIVSFLVVDANHDKTIIYVGHLDDQEALLCGEFSLYPAQLLGALRAAEMLVTQQQGIFNHLSSKSLLSHGKWTINMLCGYSSSMAIRHKDVLTTSTSGKFQQNSGSNDSISGGNSPNTPAGSANSAKEQYSNVVSSQWENLAQHMSQVNQITVNIYRHLCPGRSLLSRNDLLYYKLWESDMEKYHFVRFFE